MRDDQKRKILSTKWKSLIKRGFTKPKDAEENRKRAREAQHGN